MRIWGTTSRWNSSARHYGHRDIITPQGPARFKYALAVNLAFSLERSTLPSAFVGREKTLYIGMRHYFIAC
jgi:hypothetical protein